MTLLSLDELLKDTGEHDAVEDNLKTPTPLDLERLAAAPATMLWTLRLVQRSASTCWVKRWVRRFQIALAFALGLVIAVEAGGILLLHSMMRDSVRAAVTDVLREKKIISAAEWSTSGDLTALARDTSAERAP